MMRSLMMSVFLLFLTGNMSSYAQVQSTTNPDDLFSGTWKNEAGSFVTFVRGGASVTSGTIHGTYQTNVGQPDKNQTFPLIGFVEGDQITFTVNFKGFESMTAWTGQLTNNAQGKPHIRTLWHLTKNVENEKETNDIWKSIITGASNFERVKNIDK